MDLRQKRTLIVLSLWIACPLVCQAQEDGFRNAVASIVDGHITLDGEFRQISALEATSTGGYLGLAQEVIAEGVTVPGKAPFTENGLVVSNRPSNVTIGVLGAQNRIDFEGTTRTSVQYSGPLDTLSDDLTLNLAAGSCTEAVTIGMTTPVNWNCVDGRWEQTPWEAPSFRLIDGEIYLVGEFDGLSSIEVTSETGNLDLGQVSTGILDLSPFDGQATAIQADNSVILGALGRDSQINIEGLTRTAIRYTESLEVARSDLSVNIGLSDAVPRPLEIGATAELERGATVEDGFVTLVGSFQGLAGIEAISLGGFAIFSELEEEGSKLFSVFDSDIVANEASRIVVNAGNSQSFEGLTPTGIFFTGTLEAFAAAGIQVNVGLGGQSPVALPNTTPSVPEPHSSVLGALACAMLLALRRGR